ncbi:aldehyde dehydrogenase (NADP(+)) [Euzebyella saccharophila]|uniref:Aldehyde dehydrogenase (NADP(+)) n=1 Tax=Euzebyella saccharophila TaxID=679664 RepID=A0ABV8JT69_9FLAO|nr:aldehyde dehydrogenase (NADP(+)) [Euzebyella saccharophila]
MKIMTEEIISRKNYIGGTWQVGKGDEFNAQNPVNGEKGEAFIAADVSQVDEAVTAAAIAFEAVRIKSMNERADLLDSIADELEALGSQLIVVCNAETGLGEARLTGERGRTCNQLRSFANLVRKGDWQQARIDTAIPDRQPLPKPDIRRIYRPLGTVAVFSASNFPLAFSTLGGDTASAIAAGNTIVVKGHPSHPATTELCTRAIQKAIEKNNFPAAMFAMVQGFSPEISKALVQHPKLKAVGFTGSTHVGRILYNIGASRPNPIPVFAEMGSTNPLVIMPKAIENRGKEIATGLAGSITLGTGQFCTKPGLVLVMKNDQYSTFIADLVEALGAINIGYFLNERIKESFRENVQKTKDTDSVEIISQKENNGNLFEVSAKKFLATPELEDEIFGPAAIVVQCEDNGELVDVIKSLGGHLTGTVHADEDTGLVDVLDALEQKVGRLIFNGFPTGVEVCPSMHHGGPYPSSTFEATTSVGTAAIERFCTVKCYQNIPQEKLPIDLQDENINKIVRLVNGVYTTDNI